MRKGLIYKIDNKINNNIYIRQTILDIKTRFNLHKRKVKEGRESKLYNAMREYGFNVFNISIIEDNIPINEINEKTIRRHAKKLNLRKR